MTTEYIMRIFDARPFVPFMLIMANGREITVSHPELTVIGEYALTVSVIHPSRQVEVIDSALIVSVRTLYPVPHNIWS